MDAQVGDESMFSGGAEVLERPAPKAGQSLLATPAARIGLGLIGLLILALLGSMVFHWLTIGRYVETTNDAFLQADQVTVAPRVAGYVDAVLVSDNQDVAAGQPLVRIDPRVPAAKLEQAQALVDQNRAGIAQTEAQLSQQAAQIAQAEAQFAGQASSAAYADHEVDRYGPLAASGAETRDRLDQLKQNRDQARAQAQAGSASLLAARRQIAALAAQIDVARAQMQGAQAQARQARVDMDATLIRASLAGRIGDRSVREGQYVQPGTRMMSIVPLQGIYLVANFKETQIGRMGPGQPVEVSVDALGGRKLHGVVDSFAPGTGAQFALIPPANATGNFTKIVQRVPVRIRLDVPAADRPVIVPGLSVTVAVDTKSAPAR